MRNTYILLFVILLTGCRPPINKEKILDCEVPTPQCATTLWDGVSLDTTYFNSGKNYYYQIKQVKGLNTEVQEYAIYLNESVFSISNKQKAKFATISDKNNQRLFSIDNARSKENGTELRDAYIVKEQVFQDIPGDVGFPVYIAPNELIVSTTIKSNEDQVTLGFDWRKLQSLDATIGQSRLYNTKNQKVSEINTKIIQNNQHLLWESHPSLDRTNNILFFASDREGGYGGVDIWYMLRSGDNWSNPINAGANVNSECDDITPYVSPKENKLYFSTTGRDNVGGYDIFHIDYYVSNGKPIFDGNPKNIGKPINTEFDEFSPFFPNSSENYFYYSSDQDGDFDIYVMKKLFKDGRDSLDFDDVEKEEETIDITIKEDTLVINPTFNLEGVVKDNRTDKPVENVEVVVNKDKEEQPHKSTKTDKDGKYAFVLIKGQRYKVEVKNDTLFNDSYNVYVDKKDTNSVITRDLILDDSKTVRINFKYDKSDNPYEYILDSLGNQVNTTWQEAIDYLAEDIQKSQLILDEVIITGHTDPVGGTLYNRNLGQRRAEFVVNQLVKRGIPIYILKAKSKGETEKLVRFDSEEENQYHKRLRRVTLLKVFSK